MLSLFRTGKSFNTYIFDIDDTLYTIDSGLHKKIKERILSHALSDPFLRAKSREWLQEDRDMREKDLGTLFPLIVMEYQKKAPGALEEYFETVYGEDYHLVEKNMPLVREVTRLEKAGHKILFYTNDPSGKDAKTSLHVQKVLRALGFDEDFIERMRANTYDLVMSINAGAGKPSDTGFRNMMNHFNLKASKKIVFFDDGVKNLLPGKKHGISLVWVWTTTAPPSQEDAQLARAHKIERVTDLASFLRRQKK